MYQNGKELIYKLNHHEIPVIKKLISKLKAYILENRFQHYVHEPAKRQKNYFLFILYSF